MENPESQQLPSDISLSGLERIFVQVTNHDGLEQPEMFSEQSTNNHEQSELFIEQPMNNQSVDCESYELVTMAEAARRLKMPYPTLRRHVLSGKVESIPGSDGKPLVKLQRIEHSESSYENSTQTNEQITISSEFSANIQSLLDELKTEREYSRALCEKLDAASYRNGYLEAQLSEKETQIRLLTDSQHKPAWWSQFCAWFLNGK